MLKPSNILVTILICLNATSGVALAEPVLPKFDPQNFDNGAAITNPYFPLPTGMRKVLVATINENGRTTKETSILMFGGAGPLIMGVLTTTMLDEAYVEGRLVEKTSDYFAQDRTDNVWYLGEDVINYIYDENNKIVETNHDSAWRAEYNGALPGIMMPAQPKVGESYFQEYAERDGAMDYGEIVSVNEIIETPQGQMSSVLKIYESSTLDETSRGYKYYGYGQGLVREEEGLTSDRIDPREIFELQLPK